MAVIYLEMKPHIYAQTYTHTDNLVVYTYTRTHIYICSQAHAAVTAKTEMLGLQDMQRLCKQQCLQQNRHLMALRNDNHGRVDAVNMMQYAKVSLV